MSIFVEPCQRIEGVHGIRSPFSPATIRVCKETPGMKWNPTEKYWEGRSDAVEHVMSTLQKAGLNVTPWKKQWPSPDEAANFDALRNYQREGVQFLLARREVILADAMGLGKSATALSAAQYVNGRTLIVCPNYVRNVWSNPKRGEIAKWWPAALPKLKELSSRNAEPICNARIVICHYDILDAWAEAIYKWAPNVVIFDEAHALQNESSKRSKAARRVSVNAMYRWGLTGTPLTNRPRDLWNLVDTIRPGTFGNFFAFGLRYCDATKEQITPDKAVWKFDGKSRLDELNTRLTHFCLRRTAHDVALELPPKTRQIVYVDVPRRYRVAPNASAAEMRRSLDAAADAKLDDATDLVAGHLDSGRKVVVFTHRRAVAEYFAEKCAGSLIHGGIPLLRRNAIIEAGRNVGDTSSWLLSATIDSAATGIDLSFADTVVFVELSWEPHKLLQAEARAHRFGATRPVLVQYVIARATTDELIADAVVDKLDSFAKTFGEIGETLAKDLQESESDVLAELYAAIAQQFGKNTRVKRKNI